MDSTRRLFVKTALAAAASLALPGAGVAQRAAKPFPQWVAAFRARALARGVSAATYDRVMGSIKPDTSVYALQAAQPEFEEQTWQYVFRRASDWRVRTGKDVGKEHAAILARVEKEHGVDRHVLLALWGVESAYGDPMVQQKYMRPIFPALAALAWGEPRRRKYWEQELLNALIIVERRWSTPEEMRGSWAGAMGHTQWMPEVWLNVGIDFDGDGRVSPFGSPADALASTARYLVERGKYRRGERWGFEVTGSPRGRQRTYAAWHAAGVRRTDGEPFPHPNTTAKPWIPVPGGPAFLLGQNFYAVRSYNPSMNYTLAITHLSDRLRGEGHFKRSFPNAEPRPPTLEELQELQQRLAKAGFDPKGADGRVGPDTMRAVKAFQEKVGMKPADGYAGLKVLARLRGSS
jgi:membrane-bound lytic murein transglycosylase B